MSAFPHTPSLRATPLARGDSRQHRQKSPLERGARLVRRRLGEGGRAGCVGLALEVFR